MINDNSNDSWDTSPGMFGNLQPIEHPQPPSIEEEDNMTPKEEIKCHVQQFINSATDFLNTPISVYIDEIVASPERYDIYSHYKFNINFDYHDFNSLLKSLYEDVKPGQERLRNNLIEVTEYVSNQLFVRLAEYYTGDIQSFKKFHRLTSFFVDTLELTWNEEFPQEPLDDDEMSSPDNEASDESD